MTILDDADNRTQPQLPDDIRDYLSIDFSPLGSAAKDLNSRIGFESTQEEIPLTDLTGGQPAYLTPGMSDWFQMYVGPKRGSALSAVSSAFKERCDRAHGDGFLLPLKMAALEEDHITRKRQCYGDHSERHYVDSKKVESFETEIAEKAYRYNVKKAELGREAKVTNRLLYLSVLFFVIFGSEAALNLESFEALPWATPAIAWGATIIVGLAVGLAAHYHGTVFKQYAYWFGADQLDTKRGPAWRMVIGGLLALLLSLSFVYYARSAYLVAYLGSLGNFGQSDTNTNSLWIIGGSLLGNTIVYLVGVLWAYLLHDSDPEFADLRKELDQKRKEADSLKRKLEHLRQRDIEQLNALYRKRTEEAQRAYSQLSGQPRLAWPQDLFKKLQSKDGEVAALLQNYRGQLIQTMGPTAKRVKFIMRCDDPHVDRKPITAVEYRQLPVKLKYLEGG